MRTADDERADVLAHLARRRQNCLTVADNSAASADSVLAARIMARQLEVLADWFRAGLHEGKAAIEAQLAREAEAEAAIAAELAGDAQ